MANSSSYAVGVDQSQHLRGLNQAVRSIFVEMALHCTVAPKGGEPNLQSPGTSPRRTGAFSFRDNVVGR